MVIFSLWPIVKTHHLTNILIDFDYETILIIDIPHNRRNVTARLLLKLIPIQIEVAKHGSGLWVHSNPCDCIRLNIPGSSATLTIAP